MRCMYKLDFKTICPVDDEIIDYKCKILSNITIPVEILLKETDLLESTAIFQEDATRSILKTLVDFFCCFISGNLPKPLYVFSI